MHAPSVGCACVVQVCHPPAPPSCPPPLPCPSLSQTPPRKRSTWRSNCRERWPMKWASLFSLYLTTSLPVSRYVQYNIWCTHGVTTGSKNTGFSTSYYDVIWFMLRALANYVRSSSENRALSYRTFWNFCLRRFVFAAMYIRIQIVMFQWSYNSCTYTDIVVNPEVL